MIIFVSSILSSSLLPCTYNPIKVPLLSVLPFDFVVILFESMVILLELASIEVVYNNSILLSESYFMSSSGPMVVIMLSFIVLSDPPFTMMARVTILSSLLVIVRVFSLMFVLKASFNTIKAFSLFSPLITSFVMLMLSAVIVKLQLFSTPCVSAVVKFNGMLIIIFLSVKVPSKRNSLLGITSSSLTVPSSLK